MKLKQILIISGVVVGLLIITAIASLTVESQRFKVIETDPTEDKVSTIAPFVTLTFNEPVKSVGSATLDNTKVTTKIDDKKVKVLLSNLSAGTKSTLTLKSIESKSGKKLAEYIYTFTPQYMDFVSLSPEAQKELVNKSSSGQIDGDPFLNIQFPHYESTPDGNYIIVLKPTVLTNGVAVLNVAFTLELGYSETDQPQVPNDVAERLYQHVIATIKRLGGNPDKYEITYSNAYLNEKYAFDDENHGD